MNTREAFKRWYRAVRTVEAQRANAGLGGKTVYDFLHARYRTNGGLGRGDDNSRHMMAHKGFHEDFNINCIMSADARKAPRYYRACVTEMRHMRLEAGSKLP